MRRRAKSRLTSARTAGGLAVSLLIGGCVLLDPGQGRLRLALAGTGSGLVPSAGASPVAPPTPAAFRSARAASTAGVTARNAYAAVATNASGADVAPNDVAPNDVAPNDMAPGDGRAGTACPVSRGAGWLTAENRRPGERLTLPSGSPGRTAVVGFAAASSAVCGESVEVRLSGAPTTVSLVAYRIGHYAGAGAREVWRSAPADVRRQPVPPGTAFPHLVEPDWPVTTTITLDGRWVPGFYLLLPVRAPGTARAGSAAGPAIPFTVRDDAAAAPVLFKASTLTWAAYDEWGGWSLYHGPTGSGTAAAAARARVVSLHRPLIGAGYQQMQYMDLPVVRQLERLGLDVSYTTDEDVDARPETLLRPAEIVSGGHSEYWTGPMYDGLLHAGDAGVNLAFLGANNLWWQARLERSPHSTSTRPDRLAVYRDAGADPNARTNPAGATVLWANLNRDPAALLGQSHAPVGVHGGLQVLDAPAWFLAGSGLTEGSVLTGAVGNEADGYTARARNPATTQVFLAGVLRGADTPVVVSASYSTLPSGAAVFAAGTTDWACVPSGECFDGRPPAETAEAVGTLTRNLVLALSHRRAGATHPSTPVVPFVASQLLPQLAPAAIGTYGYATPEDGDGD